MNEDIKQIIAEMREKVGNPPYKQYIHGIEIHQSDIDIMAFLANNITAILDYISELEKDLIDKLEQLELMQCIADNQGAPPRG